MDIRRMTLDGQEFVLVPRNQWESITRQLEAPDRKPFHTVDEVRQSLAGKVSAMRNAAGLTQAQLAKLARVRVETISRLENGLHMPGAKTFDRIERAIQRAAKRAA